MAEGRCHFLMPVTAGKIILIVLAFFFCASEAMAMNEYGTDIYTDQACYAPGTEVTVFCSDVPDGTDGLRLTLFHLNETVLTETFGSFQDGVSFMLPEKDYTGYLLKAEFLTGESVLTTAQCGVDCSSTWVRFPRYGYLWDYTGISPEEDKIGQLTRYHINGLQFYDWQYRHHIPVAEDTTRWSDWSGRNIQGDSIRNYIKSAHEHGMVCMAYNMIYAANRTYLTDGSGVDPAWRLRKADGSDFVCDMNAALGPVGVLQYFNPLDPGWQEYIFARENEVFAAFGFDGWHGDTIGEMGVMKTADGGPLGYDEDGKPIKLVKNTYTQFLNAAKAAIGDHYLVFNPVGAQGIENVNKSDADVLYTEFWPWDSDDRGNNYDDYYSIHRAITRAAEQSGGKSLVVAGYINYKNWRHTFNEPAVRMMDSVVFASGGARIELGNGDRMLSDEYFPNDGNKLMDDSTRAAVRRMYDFITAYENLLRDGLVPAERTLRIDDTKVSADGLADTVWYFVKSGDAGEVLHLLNLTGTDTDWRDANQKKKVPEMLENKRVYLYTEKVPDKVLWGTPDGDDLALKELDFELFRDENGSCVSFVLPELNYWDMIFLR